MWFPFFSVCKSQYLPSISAPLWTFTLSLWGVIQFEHRISPLRYLMHSYFALYVSYTGTHTHKPTDAQSASPGASFSWGKGFCVLPSQWAENTLLILPGSLTLFFSLFLELSFTHKTCCTVKTYSVNQYRSQFVPIYHSCDTVFKYVFPIF